MLILDQLRLYAICTHITQVIACVSVGVISIRVVTSLVPFRSYLSENLKMVIACLTFRSVTEMET